MVHSIKSAPKPSCWVTWFNHSTFQSVNKRGSEDKYHKNKQENAPRRRCGRLGCNRSMLLCKTRCACIIKHQWRLHRSAKGLILLFLVVWTGDAASLLLSSDRRILAMLLCVWKSKYTIWTSTGPCKYYTPRSCLAMERAMTLPAHCFGADVNDWGGLELLNHERSAVMALKAPKFKD